MKVSNVSIVKAKSFFEAIKVAVDDFFNPEYAATCIHGMTAIDEAVYTSLHTDDSLSYSTRNITEYFICSKLPCGLVKVENCTNTEWVDK